MADYAEDGILPIQNFQDLLDLYLEDDETRPIIDDLKDYEELVVLISFDKKFCTKLARQPNGEQYRFLGIFPNVE